MDLDRVHITPVSPDASTSGRYASSEEHTPSDRESHADQPQGQTDRLEISDTGRLFNKALAAPPDMDFARKALDRLATDEERTSQLVARIESGYYASPGVIDQVVARMVPVG